MYAVFASYGDAIRKLDHALNIVASVYFPVVQVRQLPVICDSALSLNAVDYPV